MPLLRGAFLVALFAGGFAMVFVADLADRIESHGMQALSGIGPVKATLCCSEASWQSTCWYATRKLRWRSSFDRADQGDEDWLQHRWTLP